MRWVEDQGALSDGWTLRLEDVAQSAVTGGLIGLATGGLPGAVVGTLGGALAPIAGTFAAKAAYGLTESKGVAEGIRLATEFLVGLATPAKPAFSKELAEVIRRIPQSIKLGTKVAATALATGYIAEPYLEDDGELAGVAALAGASVLALPKLRPLGTWLEYTARSIVSQISQGRYGAGVVIEEGVELPAKVVTGMLGGLAAGSAAFMASDEDSLSERLGAAAAAAVGGAVLGAKLPKVRTVRIPKLTPDLQVKAVDLFKPGLQASERVIAPLAVDLERAIGVLRKHGIEPGTQLSQRIGQALWQEFKDGEELRSRLLEAGVPKEALDEVAEAVLDAHKAFQKIGQALVELGGAGEHYIKQLGSEHRVFQHVFAVGKQADTVLDELLKRLALKHREPVTGIARVSATFERGIRVPFARFHKRAVEQLGREPKLGDSITVKGVRWTLVKTREDKNPVWWAETRPNQRTLFLDIAASFYKGVAEDLRLVRQLAFYDWIAKAARERGLISPEPKTGFVKMPDRNPGAPRVVKPWGALTGQYVHPDLYRAIVAFTEMERYEPKLGVMAKVNRYWKSFFLSLNWKSYVNAILGNIMLAFANGFDPFEVLYYGLKELGRGPKSSLYREAREWGILKSAFRWEREAVRDARELQKLLEEAWIVGKVKPRNGRFGRITDFILNELPEKTYGRIDEVFRLGMFAMLRERGVGVSEAAQTALQAFGYYGDMPVLVRHLRDTIVPFVSFQFRIFPQLVRTFVQYPERYATMLAFIEGLQRYAFIEAYGPNWREGKRYEELVAASYLNPNIAGLLTDYIRVPSMRIGSEVIPGGYMYIGFVPWNLPISVPQATAEAGLLGALPIVLIQNPIIRFVSGLFYQVDPATGRKVLEMAGVNRPLASVVQWAMRSLAPSPPLMSHYIGELLAKEGWLDPVVAWFNWYGTYPDGTPVVSAHMLWNALAPSILKFDPEFNLQMSLYRLQAVENEYRRRLAKAIYRGASLPVILERWEDYERAVEENWAKALNIIEAYKATGRQ